MSVTSKITSMFTKASTSGSEYRVSFGNYSVATNANIQYRIYLNEDILNNYNIAVSYEYYCGISVKTICPNGGDPILNNGNYVVSSNVLSTESFTVKKGSETNTCNYNDTIFVDQNITITPNINTRSSYYTIGYFVFENNKLLNVGTAKPQLYYYYADNENSLYYTFDSKSTVIPRDTITYNMCIYPSVPDLLYKTRISIGYNTSSYYDGILYEASIYISDSNKTTCTVARAWSYSYTNQTNGRHTAEIYTYADNLIVTDYTYTWGFNHKYVKFEIKPYAYTRFNYPSTIDRIVKCVDVLSYFSDYGGSSYVQNGSVSMASSSDKAGTTDIFTSMPDKYVVYGSPAYLQVSIVPSTTGKGDEKYITKVNIYAYTGDKLQGTITMDATKYSTYKYNYIQKESAYTFTFDVVTRKPKLSIINYKSTITIPNVSWDFKGGALYKKVTTDINGKANEDLNNVKTEYTAIKVTSLSIPEAYRCFCPKKIYLTSYGFPTETYAFAYSGSGDYRNFSYTIGGSSIQQYNYDITAFAIFGNTEKMTTYVTPMGGSWYENVPDFAIYFKTSLSYTNLCDYYNNTNYNTYIKFAYVTSMQISKNVTLQPGATGYAYIGDVTVSKAKADGSGKTKLISFTAEPKSSDYITAVSENTMLDSSYVTYVDVMVCAYHYPVRFATNGVGKYTINVNDTIVTVCDFSNSVAPITYAEFFNVKYALPDNEKYEALHYNMYAYVYDNINHTGTYNVIQFAKNLDVGEKYFLVNLLATNNTLNPCELFVIEPIFTETKEPDPVSVISKWTGTKYIISINNKTNQVGLSDVTVTSMVASGSITMGTITPEHRQYAWKSEATKITYTNTDGVSVTKTGIKENDSIKKPSDLSGTLSKVEILPLFTTKTTFNVSFCRYAESGATAAPKPNYTVIKWYDKYTTGTSSLVSENPYENLDTLLPAGDTFGIESITLDDANYEIAKIQSTTDNGRTWIDRTLGKSEDWAITDNTTVMPVLRQAVKEMNLNFLPVGVSDYTVVYLVDGVEQSKLYVNKSSSGTTTVTFKSSSKIIFKSIAFESVEYGVDKITIDNTGYSLNKEYSFFNPSANYYDVNITEKADYSKLEYKLNINAQRWTDEISDHFMYDVILSDEYFNLKTDEIPEGADSINKGFVRIDSEKYNNSSAMTLPVTYVGGGVPTSPNVDIMFYVDNNAYNYRVKQSGYSPYTAAYTSSGDYNWTVPVSEAFEINTQKEISYIVQVSATKYNFRGLLVPYDTENKTSITSAAKSFGVKSGIKTTYTLADPETIGLSPKNYGIMVSNSQIEVKTDTWQNCKYKLVLSPITIPIDKSYSTINIFNNNFQQVHKVSATINSTAAFDNKNNEVTLAYYTKISIPYKLNNPSKTTISLTITSIGSDKSFGLSDDDSNTCFVQSNINTGVLDYVFDISPNATFSPEKSTFYIKHIY